MSNTPPEPTFRPLMTGPEHYKEAERLLQRPAPDRSPTKDEMALRATQANAHATLAGIRMQFDLMVGKDHATFWAAFFDGEKA